MQAWAGQDKLARLVLHVGIFWGGLDWAALNDTLLKRPAFFVEEKNPGPTPMMNNHTDTQDSGLCPGLAADVLLFEEVVAAISPHSCPIRALGVALQQRGGLCAIIGNQYSHGGGANGGLDCMGKGNRTRQGQPPATIIHKGTLCTYCRCRHHQSCPSEASLPLS